MLVFATFRCVSQQIFHGHLVTGGVSSCNILPEGASMKYVFRMNSLAKRTIGDRKILFARNDSGNLLLLVNDNLGREPVNSYQPRIIIDDDIVNEFGLQDDCRFQLVPTNGEAIVRYLPHTVEEDVDVYEERYVPVFGDSIGIVPMKPASLVGRDKSMFKFKYNPAIDGRPASFGMAFVGMQNRVAALAKIQQQNPLSQIGTRVERVKVRTEKKVLNSKLVVERIHSHHANNDEFRLVNIGLATVGSKVSGDHPIITVAVMSEAA